MRERKDGLAIPLRAKRGRIEGHAVGPTLESLIDTCLKDHDNARKSGMKE
jgi:hypothetical protein